MVLERRRLLRLLASRYLLGCVAVVAAFLPSGFVAALPLFRPRVAVLVLLADVPFSVFGPCVLKI